MALVGLCVIIVVPLSRHRQWRRSRRRTRGDEESDLNPRRSSLRDQKMRELQIRAGPDALLPLIDPVSNISWSDLRSKNSSASSLEEATYSFRTDNATTSHGGSRADSPSGMDESGQGVADTKMSPPTSKRNPTPPGFSSKIDASTASPHRSSMPSLGVVQPSTAAMYPLTPVSPVFSTVNSSSSRSRAGGHRRGMEPVMEDSSDHQPPPVRQLPSPPSSPDQPQAQWQASSSRHRPSVASTQSSPSALPFRPRSSTGPSIPLAAAFQTSTLHSPNAHSSHVSSTTQRYPSITTPSFRNVSRSRASTVSLDVGPDAQVQTGRATDAFRRMSTTDIRHRRIPSAATAVREQPQASSHITGPAHLSQFQEAGPSMSRRQSVSSSFAPVPSPRPLPSPPVTAQLPHSQSSTGAALSPSGSQPRWGQQLLQAQQQPALVRRKDSLALRPLPASPFVQTIPTSPPSRAPSGSSSSTRSRSHSVMSERSLPRHLPPIGPLPPMEMPLSPSSSGHAPEKSA
ncbi:uncharacterized protein FIBRA_06815 [Fibroporia radiculosa]|uniref:Uncharacterized protein n=1 Tax=Fibroporia radiculosa TaxID=599839 RepID=J4IBG7_9APHY|nr:uncharacterized protein FIBRA_06815 [Fibroporia radiculosa]CCM04631.1 predicted protein [Fibroporia radiculosa]